MVSVVWFLWMTVGVGQLTVAQSPGWRESTTGSAASLRGLAAASHSTSQQAVMWASGSKGTVLLTNDLGQSWQNVGPKEHAALDFRSLHAWNETQAIVASAGSPAVVLKTSDGGQSWHEVLRDPRPEAFFDGLKFIDAQRGVLFGDPIQDRFTVLTTADAGQSWQPIDRHALPTTRTNEAAFAASNSAMLVAAPSSIWIGTGGSPAPNSRVLVSHDFGKTWQAHNCPLVSHASSGIFSLAMSPTTKVLVAVGGDYRPDAQSPTTGALSLDQGQNFQPPARPPLGYRSAVVFAKDRFIATGPAGTDWSTDGQHWQKISDIGFHALAVLPDGRAVAVGSDGRFGIWQEQAK